MTTFYDIPADMLIPALANRLGEVSEINAPDWSEFVKTGADREKPPTQENWWEIRAASLLRKVAKHGPVGVTNLAQDYGGSKNNGSMPNTPGVASRHVIRTSLQQLEAPDWWRKYQHVRLTPKKVNNNYTLVGESHLKDRRCSIK